MKQIVLVTWLTALTAGIVAVFWYSEWKYQLPTPVPENYVAVATGTKIAKPEAISSANHKRPFFIHFFNPDCPCSKFNVPQFRTLVNEHKNDMDFMIVVLNNEKYSADQIRKKFDLDVPVSFDTSLATTCGVYSTPQAVLVDENSNLYYRGNYNKTRYCTDKKTSYAAMAIEAVLAKKHSLNFDKSALTAYGCQLPTCTK
ncbi:MAG: redoxin family protein [Flavitalea sp.]